MSLTQTPNNTSNQRKQKPVLMCDIFGVLSNSTTCIQTVIPSRYLRFTDEKRLESTFNFRSFPYSRRAIDPVKSLFYLGAVIDSSETALHSFTLRSV